ncbi:ester cyclase [Streptomyces sp. H10-C2]|uniref:ester cyclase n=1 Tax=unclassified Streptomyces TaxID=2593676 RepID=UPI0024BB540A|nr:MULTISPECIES: ester cyclase [unclassified Streptomyces]MDJ0340604.1 ester cyclase [Streptomyces sp. PH10-H1]MDJ0370252.1 ester cyclase [Streptomyces sp. H10-C2]
MAFVQIIDCKTSRLDEMNLLMDTWVEKTKGKRTATHSMIGKDRSDDSHLVEIVEFPSYEEAMRNSNMPETNRIFEEMVALCDGVPTFTNLDVVRDDQLNKAVAGSFFEVIAGDKDLAGLSGILTADYIDHDPYSGQDARGIEGFRETVGTYQSGFDMVFTLDSQLADGDMVATRWTWRATQTGEFMGLAPTSKQVVATGQTTHRMREGKIAECWWNYDLLGMLQQLGAIEMPPAMTR